MGVRPCPRHRTCWLLNRLLWSDTSPDPPHCSPDPRWGRATGPLRTACYGDGTTSLCADRSGCACATSNILSQGSLTPFALASEPYDRMSLVPCSLRGLPLRDGRPQAPIGPGPAREALATSAAHRSGEASNGTYPAIEEPTHPLPFAPPRVGGKGKKASTVINNPTSDQSHRL